MRLRISPILLLAFFAIACSKETVSTETPLDDNTSNKPNILLIIADDMGLDATPGFDIWDEKPTVPNLQKMINSGVRFTNLWSYPTCTPTRSSILTGKYGFRTGVMKVDNESSLSETWLQKFLDNNNTGYDQAVIGYGMYQKIQVILHKLALVIMQDCFQGQFNLTQTGI